MKETSEILGSSTIKFPIVLPSPKIHVDTPFYFIIKLKKNNKKLNENHQVHHF